MRNAELRTASFSSIRIPKSTMRNRHARLQQTVLTCTPNDERQEVYNPHRVDSEKTMTHDRFIEETPFFTDEHARLAASVANFAAREVEPLAVEGVETDEHFRQLLSLLAQADLLRYSVARGDGTPLDARSGRRGDGRAELSAFIVGARMPGFRVLTRTPLIADHPIGEIEFEGVRVPAEDRVGKEGEGFRLAMLTMDMFRASVGAAGCGMARRALDEAIHHAKTRRQFGVTLAMHQLIQEKLAVMQTELDAARLLVYRAAHLKDGGASGPSMTRAASQAKLYATETAQRVVDESVQIHGGYGLVRGHAVERLYRDVRALRIYEGTSEIQKLIIAREMLKE